MRLQSLELDDGPDRPNGGGNNSGGHSGTVLVPTEAAGPLSDALQSVRQGSAAPAGIVAVVLLLVNGSSFFSNMGSVFDQAYHVQSRNFLMQRVLALLLCGPDGLALFGNLSGR